MLGRFGEVAGQAQIERQRRARQCLGAEREKCLVRGDLLGLEP